MEDSATIEADPGDEATVTFTFDNDDVPREHLEVTMPTNDDVYEWVDPAGFDGQWEQDDWAYQWRVEDIEPNETVELSLLFGLEDDFSSASEIEPGVYGLVEHGQGFGQWTDENGDFDGGSEFGILIDTGGGAELEVSLEGATGVPGDEIRLPLTITNTGERISSGLDKLISVPGGAWKEDSEITDPIDTVQPGSSRTEEVVLIVPEVDPGEYEIYAQAEDDAGAFGEDTATVTVEDEPEIHDDMIRLSHYAIEPGDEHPEIAVQVDNAETVTVESSHHADSVELQIDDDGAADEGMWWSGQLAVDGSPSAGDRIALEIEATNEIGTVNSDSHDHPYVLERPDVGYHVVETVLDVLVVLARLAYQDSTMEAAWKHAREHDVNEYYGSERGSMGAVGFDFTYDDDDGELHEITTGRQAFEALPPALALWDFLNIIRAPWSEVDVGADFDDFDFWIGTHPGRTIGVDEDGGNTQGTYLPRDPRLGVWEQRVYAPWLLGIAREGGYDTWLHEIGHGYGLEHLYEYGDNGRVREKCVMGNESREVDESADLQPTPPMSTAMRIAETLELDLEQSEAGFGDWLEPEPTPIEDIEPVNAENTDADEPETLEIKALKAYEKDDSVGFLEHHTDDRSTYYIVEYRTHLGEGEDGFQSDPSWIAHDDGGGIVVYRLDHDYTAEEDDDEDAISFNVISLGGDNWMNDTDEMLWDSPEWADYELRFSPEQMSGETAEVTVEREVVNSERAVLTDSIGLPSEVTVPTFHGPLQRPSLHLRATDEDGNVTGVRPDGEHVNEIPGARTSGPRNGSEWIVLPGDADAEFEVTSHEIDEFVDQLDRLGVFEEFETADGEMVSLAGEYTAESLREELEGQFTLRLTEYTDDSRLVETDDGVEVSDVTVHVAEDSIGSGTERQIDEEDTETVRTPDELPGGVSIAAVVGGGAVTAGLAYLAVRMWADNN